jgi:tRNA-dihydrouridine synthase A
MMGRAAYHNPGLLAEADRILFGAGADADLAAVVHAMAEYAARHTTQGGRLAHVTRHMVGLFQGRPGARRWRQILSQDAVRPGAGPSMLLTALAEIGSGAEGPRRAA